MGGVESKGDSNLRVNENIVKFSTLSSTESLTEHYKKRQAEAVNLDWVKNLVEKLAGLSSSPQLAGLGALAIAVFIDILCLSPPEKSIEDALRSVLAEEKASEVWDLIDECLKRNRMHINDRTELVNDMRRIEEQLSQALTNLKNSVVRDGHVTNQAVKSWVNGTAFHIQMLIHLVRLGEARCCDSTKSLIFDYSADVGAVFEKHKEMIKGKCRTYRRDNFGQNRYLLDDEGQGHYIGARSFNDAYETFYASKYNSQKNQILMYFSGVEEKLPELVNQTGSLELN